MQTRLMQWLVCPICRGKLNPIARRADTNARVPSDDIMFGALTCRSCAVYYPIYNGIPRMLTYRTAVADAHAASDPAWITANLSDLTLPHREPPLGEPRILRNFSTEWLGYEWTGEGYWNVTARHMLDCKRYELGVTQGELRDKLILEVGIGIGGTADALSRAENCEVVGMDLGYSVDQAKRYFGENRLFHIVQASVFAPPFKADAFDLVYSHGVIHHTYSTAEAFACLTRLPKPAGGTLYVWVYSHDQERATVLRRALMALETAVRPVLSRMPSMLQTVLLLPTLPFYMLYQNVYARKRIGEQYTARYGWNEAKHAARDRLTPPFAFRHTYEEVERWFLSHGFKELRRLRDEPLPPGVPPSYPLNVGIRGRRN